MSSLLVTLRHNIVLESDVSLAIGELASLCRAPRQHIECISSEQALHGWLSAAGTSDEEHRFLCRALRKKGVVGFAIENGTVEHFRKIIARASFIQEAALIADAPIRLDSKLVERLTRVRPVPDGNFVAFGIPMATMLEYSAPMVFKRDKGACVSTSLDALVEFLLDGSPAPISLRSNLLDAVNAKKTTLYLSHELHLYKGKFFPRLVHSLINRFSSSDQGIVCDPFAGSGTALLEASLMGLPSVGLDVDPTSVMISEHKLALASVDCRELEEVCAAMRAALENNPATLFFEGRSYDATSWENHRVAVPEPMRGRLIKRGREEGYDLLEEIEQDAAVALLLIVQVPEHLQSIFRVCLSHALTKKLRLRFVGIGNGRFTFDVAKVRVIDLFLKKAFHMLAIAEVFTWLKRAGEALGPVKVVRSSAINLGCVCDPGSINLVVTSPPYIPASSGREHYARARAIPLVLTGAATLDELEELDRAFIGEMSGQAVEESFEDMPPSVRESLTFLKNDAQRLPKFLPTLQYYRDVKRVLGNIHTALEPNGTALFVVAKSHTFYIHKTKEILHTVDAARAICELGEQANLHVTEVINVPLAKSGGLNARPRSTDEYAEVVVVFRKLRT